ncbi:PspC domain-containing protein [Flavicella marina]|uniref:PspC domain-containing protein n=1 Tax=Flavicella marina TaxID=1475951 RepID=UPI001264E65B|nr:PspC domain-containing protein [Flavicella marina]
MNKTININLGGFFFHIDEIAYQILKNYLESIARSLSDDPQGKNEIIADIEARISELLSEKIVDQRQVVNEQDINDIIKIMGQPEDYEDAGESYDNTNNQRPKPNSKKLYRDGENKFLGGVASGLGHYLGIEFIWVRLLFIITTITIGFAVPVYIILWILLPEAKTTAEKLEMEGEAVNIDNIEKKIRTEFNNVGDKIKNADYSKAKTGFQNFLDTLGKIILTLFKIFGKVIGVLLMFVAAAVLISLVIAAFSFGSIELMGISNSFTNIPSFIYSSIIPDWTLASLIFVAIGFPFLILFLLGLRIISSSVKQLSKPTSLTLLGIWIIAILALIFTGIEHSTAKAFSGSKIQEEPFAYQVNDTLQIKMVNNDELLFKNFLRSGKSQEYVYDKDVQKLYCNNITVDVIYNDTDNATIKVRRVSKGKNRQLANSNAENIEYNYAVKDNTIELNGYFLSPEKHLSKNESVSVTISIPKNITLYFTNSTKSFLGPIETTQDLYNNDIPNHYFIMRDMGLECTDCDERLFKNQM